MVQYLNECRDDSKIRLGEVIASLADMNEKYGELACVYATGSFGRGEAGANSDLDLFIVLKTAPNSDGGKAPILRVVDEIDLKYHIITAAKDCGLPDFDGGGRFLESHSIDSFVEHLGTPADDYENTLTARLLLLLESKSILGDSVYSEVIENVISEYFADYHDHRDEFIPAYLVNDIVRMWRTFCVNYESRRRGSDSGVIVKNLKLKYSRMLTCYSAIIYLISVFSSGSSISKYSVRNMVRLSPLERLEGLKVLGLKIQDQNKLNDLVDEAISNYSEFLQIAHLGKEQASEIYGSDLSQWRKKSSDFAGKLVEIIDLLGLETKNAALLRRMVII